MSPRPVLDATTRIAAGNNHACAASADGVACWGLNTDGQLGIGTFANTSVPTPVDLGCE